MADTKSKVRRTSLLPEMCLWAMLTGKTLMPPQIKKQEIRCGLTNVNATCPPQIKNMKNRIIWVVSLDLFDVASITCSKRKTACHIYQGCCNLLQITVKIRKSWLTSLYDISNLLQSNNGISKPHHLKTYSRKTNLVGRDGGMWEFGGGGGGEHGPHWYFKKMGRIYWNKKFFLTFYVFKLEGLVCHLLNLYGQICNKIKINIEHLHRIEACDSVRLLLSKPRKKHHHHISCPFILMLWLKRFVT